MFDLKFEKESSGEMIAFDDLHSGPAYCVSETLILGRFGIRVCTGCGKTHGPRLVRHVPVVRAEA